MRLSRLLTGLYSLPANADRDISRLMLDSRNIQTSDLFFAVKGAQRDGRQFIVDAISKGAAAIIVESERSDEPFSFIQNIPIIPIPLLRQKIGEVAANFYQHPAKQLKMIGVTGTNGKTSCTHFIAQVLEAAKISCGIIGTLGNGFLGALSDSDLTTPDAITLQAILNKMRLQDTKACAMEVSSHSIDQGRANGIPFSMGLFTNLSQDHLDYHGDMQTYAAVKFKFFADFPITHCIINADDSYGRIWLDKLASQKSLYAYAIRKHESSANFHLTYTEDAEFTLQGTSAYVCSPWGRGKLFLPLLGEFNLSNALAVLNALCLYGIPFKDVLHQFTLLKSVPGRMQTFGGGHQPLVVVDYSHTPDALKNALATLRKYTAGKLICVFGCGGERDASKRPLMANIAEKIADEIIVTNDNPRSENEEEIVKQILTGFSSSERVSVILNRSKAIEKSIECASFKDCILIAGKGAERYQQIGKSKIPFDDAKEVETYLKNA